MALLRNLCILLVIGGLSGCGAVSERQIQTIIDTHGPFALIVRDQPPLIGGDPTAPASQDPQPVLDRFTRLDGEAGAGSIRILVFASVQEAQDTYTAIHDNLPPVPIGDQASLGVVSTMEDLTAYRFVLQRCTGVAIVLVSRLYPQSTDIDQFTAYGQTLDTRMKTRLCS